MLELNKIYNMDCLDGLKLLDDKSMDTVRCEHGNVLTLTQQPQRYKLISEIGQSNTQ